MIGIGKEMLVLDKIISESMLSVIRLVLLKFHMYLERICLVSDMFCIGGGVSAIYSHDWPFIGYNQSSKIFVL